MGGFILGGPKAPLEGGWNIPAPWGVWGWHKVGEKKPKNSKTSQF